MPLQYHESVKIDDTSHATIGQSDPIGTRQARYNISRAEISYKVVEAVGLMLLRDLTFDDACKSVLVAMVLLVAIFLIIGVLLVAMSCNVRRVVLEVIFYSQISQVIFYSQISHLFRNRMGRIPAAAGGSRTSRPDLRQCPQKCPRGYDSSSRHLSHYCRGLHRIYRR